MDIPNDFSFDVVAGTYDSWYDRPVGKTYDRMEKTLLEKMLPRRSAGTRLLEVGCGTGHWSAFFADRGYELTGVDVSGPMVDRARARPITGAEFQLADGRNLPFDDETFDVGVAVTVLEFVSDVPGVLSEMDRCVRTGGYILIGALHRRSPLGFSRRLNGASIVGQAHLFSRNELRRLLEGYGETQVVSGACFLPWSWALGFAEVFDFLSRRLNLHLGSFLVAKTRKKARRDSRL